MGGQVRFPDIGLVATGGSAVKLAELPGFSVIFCYPWTGRPGHPDPPDWDIIPGAHGSTPQAQRYGELWPRFQSLGVRIFGMSLQSTAWQIEFQQRMKLPFALISDEGREMTRALGLETFSTGGRDYLKRVTLIARNGAILARRDAIPDPEHDADQVLEAVEPLAK